MCAYQAHLEFTIKRHVQSLLFTTLLKVHKRNFRLESMAAQFKDLQDVTINDTQIHSNFIILLYLNLKAEAIYFYS